MNEVTRAFQEQIKLINNEEIKNVLVKALDKVPDAFLHVPASSTGKYHPSYAQGDGGLYRHTCAVVFFVDLITNLEMYEIDSDTRDMLIAAAILHDSCKGGSDWSNPYAFDHPLLVEELLSDEEMTPNEKHYWETINSDIRTHMGQWTTSKYSTAVLPKPSTKEQMILHLCDYLASRKQIEVKIFDEIEDVSEVMVKPATAPQKGFVANLIRQARTLPDFDPKYNEVEVEDLTCGQASKLISELRQLVGC